MNKRNLLFISIAFAATLLWAPAGFSQNNEYAVNPGSSYVFLVHAVNDLLNSK